MEEKIICSAIWYKEVNTAIHNCINVDKGTVVCGHRHPHCISTMVATSGLRTVTFGDNAAGEHVQGFLTNLNRFVDRKEGLTIAREQNQILPGQDREGKKTLFSEDIY